MLKSPLFVLFCLLPLCASALAADRTSQVFTGLGTALVATYSSSDSTNVTSGYYCSHYDRLLVYVSVDSVGGSNAAVAVYVDYSPDGTDYYPLSERVGNTDSTVTFKYKIHAVGSYALPFPNAGKFFRARIEKTSGTSTAVRVTDCVIEAKS